MMPDALIWGASGGIGQALVRQLKNDDWRVFTASRDIESIPEGVYDSYRFDATNYEAIREIAVDLAHQTSGLDLWVYAAGGLQSDLLRKMSPNAWSAVLDSNLTGAFLTISQTLHLIKEGGQAAFIGAYVDHLILPKMGAYAVAKAGLEPMVKVLQKENRKMNFTLVKPGAVATNFWKNVPFRMPADAKSPDIVAQAIVAQYENRRRGILAL
jgi:NAD(P)-dependent dehydrogenase (short-subunit alcohol dehydrogenase family)